MQPKVSPVYEISGLELEEMKEQIEELLANGFICPLISL